MKKHYHVFFSGTVQGVGFRYTAQSYAEKLAIYGWVANRNNGKVELDIEGESSDVNDFLSKIKEEFKSYIKSTESEELPYSGEYNDFRIRLS
jgi:acylphosphatase